MNSDYKEVEVRFLEIDQDKLSAKLKEVGAQDLGQDDLKEIIFYDRELKWKDEGKKFVRLRKNSKGVFLTYKRHADDTPDGTEEIELQVSDIDKTEAILEHMGLTAYRHQQKKRHTFKLNDVYIDIDTWPKIPAYVELEGPSTESLKQTTELIGLDWKDAVYENARKVIENRYHIPVGNMRWFTFDRFE